MYRLVQSRGGSATEMGRVCDRKEAVCSQTTTDPHCFCRQLALHRGQNALKPYRHLQRITDNYRQKCFCAQTLLHMLADGPRSVTYSVGSGLQMQVLLLQMMRDSVKFCAVDRTVICNLFYRKLTERYRAAIDVCSKACF